MAFEFAEPRKESLWFLIVEFLREASVILDESVPFPRRAALLVKWYWALHGLGYNGRPPRVEELTPRVVREYAFDMLKWVGMELTKRRLL